MKSKTIAAGLVLFILLFSNQPAVAQHSEEKALEKTAREIYDLIMCPICAGQTIARSNSETSRQMRDLVLKKLHQGETKEEVLQYFAGKYGERILADPTKKGLNMALWFLPFVLVSFAAILIFFLIRRWSTKGQPEENSQIEETRLSEYEGRLEKELKEFDEGFQG